MRKNGIRFFPLFNGAVMVLLMAATLYPLAYVVFASFSDPVRLSASNGLLLYKPLGFSLEGYRLVLNNPNLVLGYRNTLLYLVLGTSVNLLMTTLGAFVLSREGFLLKRAMVVMVVVTLYFSGGMIPRFLVVNGIGLVNTIWALILPGAISTWNLMIMRTSFASIPADLEEAARIDGANDVLLLLNIVLPLSMPVLAVMTLYYGVGHWNAWFDAMIYLRDTRLHPLQLFLRDILIMEQMGDMSSPEVIHDFFNTQLVKYCAIIVSTVPILCAYPFLQRYFVKGVMVGALKG